MTTRLLPIGDWPRLAGTELETVWPHLPATARIVVVEDEAGSIVACWALFSVVHVEGLWIAPQCRKRGAAARRLLAAMRTELASLGARAVMTAAISDDIKALIARFHGSAVPGDHFVVPLGVSSCQPS